MAQHHESKSWSRSSAAARRSGDQFANRAIAPVTVTIGALSERRMPDMVRGYPLNDHVDGSLGRCDQHCTLSA